MTILELNIFKRQTHGIDRILLAKPQLTNLKKRIITITVHQVGRKSLHKVQDLDNQVFRSKVQTNKQENNHMKVQNRTLWQTHSIITQLIAQTINNISKNKWLHLNTLKRTQIAFSIMLFL